jgi:putative autotransporter adhesin-like protein
MPTRHAHHDGERFDGDTMHLARRPLLVSAALAVLIAPRLALASPRTVAGSGSAAKMRRDLGPFSGISLAAPCEVVLRPGSREAIEISADDNVIPLIETTVRGSGTSRSLQIELARDTRVEPRTPMVVIVDYVRLEALAVGGGGRIGATSLKASRLDASIGGSGAIDLADLDAGELAISIGGSGAFRGDGRARRVSVDIGGSGRCEAERLVASDVAVSVAGSGTARVRAEAALQVSIAGSGDVFHRGAATPQVAIVGSGRVLRL